MPRTIEITVPPTRTDGLQKELEDVAGVLGLQVQRGTSIRPPGDVITVQATGDGLRASLKLLQERGVGMDTSSSIVTAAPVGVISPHWEKALPGESSDALWEEMETQLAKESNMGFNGLALMCLSGFIAALGIHTNALHLVIGAMAIAPGFGPIVRLGLGIVAGNAGWRTGLWHAAKGYATMMVAAAAAALLLRALGMIEIGEAASYLEGRALVSYWTSITATGLAVSAAAGVAGVIVIAANRSVLTAGVMIALALVPTVVISAMALVTGELTIAGRGMLRFLIEVGFVLVASLAVLAWKRLRSQPRATMLQEHATSP
jgi:hypothetical protein